LKLTDWNKLTCVYDNKTAWMRWDICNSHRFLWFFAYRIHTGGLRCVEAIVSGLRTFKRAVKRASSSTSRQKSDHRVHEQAQCELDTRADTICAGKNCRIISLTGQTCKAFPWHHRRSGRVN
jgi:hypothetical protein